MINILYRNSTTPTVPATTSAKGTILTYDELDGNFRSIKDGIETHTGATGAAHGAATTLVNGFMTTTQVGQLNTATSDVATALANAQAASDNAVAMAIALG